MVRLTTRTRRTDGTTFVACRLANDAAESQTVRIASRLDGPATPPPRYAGADATLRLSVPANATVGTGFASPAPPVDPAAELVGTEASTGQPAAAVLAALSDPRPPRGATVDDGPELPDPSQTTAPADAWLADCEERVDRLAAVAAATTVPAAAQALADEGGLDAVDRLAAQVARDRERLLAVADEAATLAARAEATDVPRDALERLS